MVARACLAGFDRVCGRWVNQIKPWDWFEGAKPKPKSPPQVVKLTEPRAVAYAPLEWEAEVRVVNGTNHRIQVERVVAVFGKTSYGDKCDKRGDATQVLYPVVEPGRSANVFQPIQPGQGTRFKGGQNLDKKFRGASCRLAVARLTSAEDRKIDPSRPQDRATFRVLTNDGKTWTTTTALLYEPRLRVEGGGGLPCIPGLPLLPGCPF